MTGNLQKLMAWVDEISAARPECEVTLKVENIDNPGWSLTLDAMDVGIDPGTVACLDETDQDGGWLILRIGEREIKAVCGPRGADRAAAALWAVVRERAVGGGDDA